MPDNCTMEGKTRSLFPILSKNTGPKQVASLPSRKDRTLAARAKYERFWRENTIPEFETAQERVRIERTLSLGKTWGFDTCPNIVDLGCGDGKITCLFASLTRHMTALDIAQNALSRLSSPAITRILGSMPDTPFPDGSFQAVLCTDLLTELDPRDYRLAVSEMARILAPGGLLLFSCPIDYTTDRPVPLLRQLLSTEFTWLAEEPSYHRLWKWTKKIVSTLSLWFPGRESLLSSLQQNRTFLLFCERLSRLWWAEAGITHLLVCARKKPLPFL